MGGQNGSGGQGMRDGNRQTNTNRGRINQDSKVSAKNAHTFYYFPLFLVIQNANFVAKKGLLF